jgi:hypothetical protein
MTKYSPRPCNLQAQSAEIGMGRFFNLRNLDRYRKLAGGTIDVTERQRVLEALAEEMNAFRREARMLAGRHLRSLEGDVASPT